MAKTKQTKPKPPPAPAPAIQRRGVFVRRRVPPRIKVGVIVLCLAVLAAAGYWGIYPQAVAYSHWRHAQTALGLLDFEGARHDLESCADVWKNSGETQFLLARTCRRQGDFEAARQHLREAKRLHWVEQQVSLEATLQRVQAGLLKQAEPVLRGYLERGDPDSRLILEALVMGSMQANFLAEAYHWADAWCENFGDDWEAHYWRGNVLLLGLNLQKAGPEFEQALAGNPNFTGAHLQLAEVLRRRGRYDDAVQHFQTVLHQRPEDASALLGLARCERALNVPAEAQAALDRLLAINPKSVDALRLRGQLEIDNDKPDAALHWLEQANSVAPNNKDTVKALAEASRLLNRPADVQKYETQWKDIDTSIRRLEEITHAVANDSRDVELRYEAATILLHLGRRRDALPWLTSILQMDPKHEQARKTLLQLVHDLNDPTLTAALERLKQSQL